MKTILYFAFIAAICCAGSGCRKASPPTPSEVGRYQLRTEDTIVVFDTMTGRIYIGRTNGTFVVRDPVFEATQTKESK
jgi:hypothetical protein